MVEILHNAHKLAYLVKMFPDQNILETFKLLQLPEIDLNTAMWYAEEIGLLKREEGKVSLAAEMHHNDWVFGEDVAQLRDRLEYGFKQLAKLEADFEEYSLQRWLEGYPLRDRLITLAWMVEAGILAEYTIVDDVQNDGSEYTFYTLADNRDKEWGRKQFKEAPKAPAKNPAEKQEPKPETKH